MATDLSNYDRLEEYVSESLKDAALMCYAYRHTWGQTREIHLEWTDFLDDYLSYPDEANAEEMAYKILDEY